MMSKKFTASSLVALGLLSGCFGGGGGDDTPPPPPPPPPVVFFPGTDIPAAAEKQVDQVIAYGKSQIAMTTETREPVLLGDAILATSDTTEPSDV